MEEEMPKACCNWCNSIIKVETGYNPMIHRRYCSTKCLGKDAEFEEYYSDENIGLRDFEEYGINTNTGERK